MKESTWLRLEKERRNFPMMFAGPVDQGEVEEAQKQLGVRFAPDYVDFIRRYGGAMVGSDPVVGLRSAEVMGDESVVDLTRRFQTEGWRGTENWYVISFDGAGNPVGMDRDGHVWLSDHNSGEIVEVARTFEAFVLGLLGESPP